MGRSRSWGADRARSWRAGTPGGWWGVGCGRGQRGRAVDGAELLSRWSGRSWSRRGRGGSLCRGLTGPTWSRPHGTPPCDAVPACPTAGSRSCGGQWGGRSGTQARSSGASLSRPLTCPHTLCHGAEALDRVSGSAFHVASLKQLRGDSGHSGCSAPRGGSGGVAPSPDVPHALCCLPSALCPLPGRVFSPWVVPLPWDIPWGPPPLS